MATMFEFNTNKNLTPKYAKDTVLILQKDYTTSSYNKYLTVGAVCSIIEGGLSKYPRNAETGKRNGDTDGAEWCHVFVSTPRFDPNFEEGYVRASDLKKYELPL